MTPVPQPRASGAVIRNGKVLMVRHREQGKEYWTLPGGGVKPGESFEEAAVREMREETGLKVTVKRILWEGRGGALHEKCFLLECADDKQEVRLGEDPELAGAKPEERMLIGIKWFSLEEMKDDVQIKLVRKALGIEP